MGKATEYADYMASHPLTPAEERQRQAATESGGEVEGTSDGRVVARAKPHEKPRVVVKAPSVTWD